MKLGVEKIHCTQDQVNDSLNWILCINHNDCQDVAIVLSLSINAEQRRTFLNNWLSIHQQVLFNGRLMHLWMPKWCYWWMSINNNTTNNNKNSSSRSSNSKKKKELEEVSQTWRSVLTQQLSGLKNIQSWLKKLNHSC